MLYLDRDSATKGAEPTIIDRYKADHTIETLAINYGYIKRSATEYQSPNSKSGHLVKLSENKDMLISLSDSDTDIGRQINEAWCADAFDLFIYYECGNDIKIAIEKLKEIYPLQPLVKQVSSKEIEQPEGNIGNPDVSAKINWIRLSELAERPVKEREWTVDGWIPKGQVTLLYADGGVGKSQIILQLLTSVSLGERWFGLDTTMGSALYLGAEDDTDELHRRFDGVINARFRGYTDFPDVIFSSLAGEDALLASYDPRSKKIIPSEIMQELTVAIAEHRPSICVIDTLADVFPADENDRALARQFIGMLRKPAIEHKCALVVLAHPSLSGLSTGRGTSGSTGWNNSVRSRITMERDPHNDDRRILKLAKSNYSKIGTDIAITYENGVFVHDPQSSGLDAQAASSKAKRVFLSLLKNHNENGMHVNANGGSTYAPKVFGEHPESEGVTKKAFNTAMKSLLAEKLIRSEQTKRGTRLVMMQQ